MTTTIARPDWPALRQLEDLLAFADAMQRLYAAIVLIDGEDSEVLRECLLGAANGPFFPDWEFSILFGLDRDVVRRVAEEWPSWDNEGEQSVAVNNALNHLLGYPHKRWDVWSDYISSSPIEVVRVLARWRGEDEFDPSGRGYFDRLQ
jgi:hypothetical protein